MGGPRSRVHQSVQQRAMAKLPGKATHGQTRTFNQQLVLRAIYDRAEISRAELARVTGLTRTSITALVGALLRGGLVEEVGRGPSTGGKAPIMLRLRPEGRHAIGLDLGESAFSGGLVDLRGNVVQSARVELDGRKGNDAVDVVFGLIDTLVRRNGANTLLGVGIGAPGLVDSHTGTVRWSVNLDWADLPLGTLVNERFDTPAVVVNDSQAAALAESAFGDQDRPSNMIVVRVGRGIGAGIILNGRLFQGDGAAAGEIGHTIFVDGPTAALLEPCRCGRQGCLETLASMPAMVRAAQLLDPAVDNETELISAFRAGNPAVRDVVLRAGSMLGQGIAAMIATLNVNHVVLIGQATQLGDEWLDAIRRQAEMGALPLLARDTSIQFGRSRDDDVVIGASAMLITHALGLGPVR